MLLIMKKLLAAITLTLVISFPSISNADAGTIVNVVSSIWGGLEEKPKLKLPKFLKKKEKSSQTINVNDEALEINPKYLRSLNYEEKIKLSKSLYKGANKSFKEKKVIRGCSELYQISLLNAMDDKLFKKAKKKVDKYNCTQFNFAASISNKDTKNIKNAKLLCVSESSFVEYRFSNISCNANERLIQKGSEEYYKALAFIENKNEDTTKTNTKKIVKNKGYCITKLEENKFNIKLKESANQCEYAIKKSMTFWISEYEYPKIFKNINEKSYSGYSWTFDGNIEKKVLLNLIDGTKLYTKLIKDKKIVKVKNSSSSANDLDREYLSSLPTNRNFYNTDQMATFYNQLQTIENLDNLSMSSKVFTQKYYNKKSKEHWNEKYPKETREKAWAQAPDGAWAWRTAGTELSAVKQALDACSLYLKDTFYGSKKCVVVKVGDKILNYEEQNYYSEKHYGLPTLLSTIIKDQSNTKVAKKEIKKKKTSTAKKKIINEFDDLPDAEFYFYAFKDDKNYFIGYLNQDPSSKMIKIGNRKFREGNKGKAYTEKGDICKVYSSVDKPNTKNRTYTGTATLDCKNNSKFVGNWVQYGPKGSGKAINENNGESIDFYFTMNKLTAIADLKYFKQDQKIKVAKKKEPKKKEPKQEEFKPKKTNQDNEAPVIEIAENITVSDSAYEIQGNVKDKSKKIFIEVDGKTFIPVNKGKFKLERFSPVDEQIKIVAIDQWGNRSKPKIVNVIIDDKDTEIAQKIEPLNPSKMRSKKNKDRIALIIGIENYDQTPKATFANMDAKYFYEYVRKGFGVSKSNIKLLIDEDANLIKSLGTLNKWLPGKIKSGQSELILFFAGHGLASSDGKELYILSQDSDPDLLARTALSRSELFKEIINLNPKSVTMFFDTCFSGISRDEKTLLASARPIRIVADEEGDIPNNFTIFSASQLDQISSGLKEANQGIFSYYLMKGLEGKADSNQDRKITNGELLAYMDENISQKASELGRQQNPSFAGNPDKILINY